MVSYNHPTPRKSKPFDSHMAVVHATAPLWRCRCCFDGQRNFKPSTPCRQIPTPLWDYQGGVSFFFAFNLAALAIHKQIFFERGYEVHYTKSIDPAIYQNIHWQESATEMGLINTHEYLSYQNSTTEYANSIIPPAIAIYDLNRESLKKSRLNALQTLAKDLKHGYFYSIDDYSFRDMLQSSQDLIDFLNTGV